MESNETPYNTPKRNKNRLGDIQFEVGHGSDGGANLFNAVNLLKTTAKEDCSVTTYFRTADDPCDVKVVSIPGMRISLL